MSIEKVFVDSRKVVVLQLGGSRWGQKFFTLKKKQLVTKFCVGPRAWADSRKQRKIGMRCFTLNVKDRKQDGEVLL
jgi:hypothetical protein